MRNPLLLVAFLLQLALFSCKDPQKNIYEGCCGTEPVTDSIPITITLWDPIKGMLVDSQVVARMYIPNILIPDSSGADNSYFITCGTYVDRIVSAKYFDSSGDLLFERGEYQICDANNSWHGEKAGGGYYYGTFNYQIVVRFENGETKTYSRKACSYKCGDDGFPKEKLPECAFPTQHDGNGGFDPSLYFSEQCF